MAVSRKAYDKIKEGDKLPIHHFPYVRGWVALDEDYGGGKADFKLFAIVMGGLFLFGWLEYKFKIRKTIGGH